MPNTLTDANHLASVSRTVGANTYYLHPEIDVSVLTYGADNTGANATATTAAFNNAISAIVNSGKPGRLFIPAGTYAIDGTITVDVAYVSIIANGARIDATAVTSGAAFLFIGSSASIFYQAKQFYQGFELFSNRGNPSTPNIGIKFDSTGYSGNTSRISLYNLVIHGFNQGMYLGVDHYMARTYGTDIWDCDTCIYAPSLGQDIPGGPAISFDGCGFYNSNLGINAANPDGDYFFTNCVFQCTAQGQGTGQLLITGSIVCLSQCHLEQQLPTSGTQMTTPIIVNTSTGSHASLVMEGGMITFSGTVYTYKPSNVINNTSSTTTGGVLLSGVYLNNLQTTSGLATGSGWTRFQNCVNTLVTAPALDFQVNGSSLFKLDNAGNVGMGTSTPNAWSSVTGLAGSNFQNYAAANQARVIINSNASTPELHMVAGANDANDRNYRLQVNFGDITLDQPSNDYSTTQQLMTWTNAGKVGIGTASPTGMLSINTGTSSTDGLNINGTGSNVPLRINTSAGSIGMLVNSSGNVGIGINSIDSGYILQLPNSSTQKAKAYSWDTYACSDRYKKGIAIISDPMERVRKLEGITFLHDRQGELMYGQVGIGITAEQLEATGLPHVITKDDSGEYTGINLTNLIPLLVESIKELEARLQKLEETRGT